MDTFYKQFDNPKLVEKITRSIIANSQNIEQINLMEVCGTHTMSIAKFGLKNLLPKNINLISGPGCPVCVTPNKSIDKMIALCKNPDIIITTFGDMMRVPGSTSSLIKEKAKGAQIEIVYSPLDSLKIANENPDKQIVFLAVGFETTAPITAASIIRAKSLGLKNFSVFCTHKNMPGALELIVNDKNVKVDGLILPGHVSTITGIAPYQFLAEKYNIPGAISGFEAVDIMYAINELVTQISQQSKASIINAYKRGVKDSGNKDALNLINKVFDKCDSTWRGLGSIKNSGFIISEAFKMYDAEQMFDIISEETKENKACKCGDVLRGIINPTQCPLYSKKCNPQNPIGPCMVSSEGTCSAYYKYS